MQFRMRQLLLLLLLLFVLTLSSLLLHDPSAVVVATTPLFYDQDDINTTEICHPTGPYLEKFVQPLTFPPTIDVSLAGITLGAYKVSQNLHPDLPNTTLYAFGTSQETAAFPGPTLMARAYMAAHVRWENHILDEHHFLPQAEFVEWANPNQGGVPIVVHLHGAEVPSIYDGHPDAWLTARNETGPTFVTQDYIYPNEQPAAALWYHDHTYGITRLNVLAGLAGTYIIRPTPNEEEILGLPDGAPLIFKDMTFDNNGSLVLPGPQFDPTLWCIEHFEVWLVNGKVWPYVRVFAKPYRFRLLNACNARIATVYFNETITIPFWQIGTDGGLLREPMLVDPYLMFSPGERVDVIIDFSGITPNSELVLHNALIGTTVSSPDYLVIMKFIVVEENGLQEGLIEHNSDDYLENLREKMQRMDSSSHHLAKIVRQQQVVHTKVIDEWHIDKVREVIIVNHLDLTNGMVDEITIGVEKRWRDPVDIIAKLGSYEVWEVINLANGVHNFHLHLVQFQVVNQQTLDGDSYLIKNCSLKIPYPQNGSCFTNYPQSPSSYQQGWKDTFIIFSKSVIRILIHFTSRDREFFTFDATQGPGYVLHCHVNQHEDHSMMRPYILISNNETTI